MRLQACLLACDLESMYNERDGVLETAHKEALVDLVKVAANSRSTSVAGAIAGIIREKGRVDVQAIGAGAVNQAIKAIAIARGYLEMDHIDIVCIPEFSEVSIDGKERTAMKLAVESGHGVQPEAESTAVDEGKGPP
jgi:stage V sporulation protein S